jgi:hypothetical protein
MFKTQFWYRIVPRIFYVDKHLQTLISIPHGIVSVLGLGQVWVEVSLMKSQERNNGEGGRHNCLISYIDDPFGIK